MILEEGPFSLWDSELGEVDISADSFTTFGVPEYLEMWTLVQKFLELPWAKEEDSLWGFPH